MTTLAPCPMCNKPIDVLERGELRTDLHGHPRLGWYISQADGMKLYTVECNHCGYAAPPGVPTQQMAVQIWNTQGWSNLSRCEALLGVPEAERYVPEGRAKRMRKKMKEVQRCTYAECAASPAMAWIRR